MSEFAHLWTGATITPFTAVASNGTTPVQLVAGVAGQRIIPFKVSFRNADTTWHTVSLVSKGAGNATTIFPVEIAPGGQAFLDNDFGWLRTLNGEGLFFQIETGGSLVTASGVGIQ